MPMLELPDGCELPWEERGEGPTIVMVNMHYWAPELLEPLVEDLAADHRVVTYDVRGTGDSTAQPPYDIATDAADLGALLQASGPATVAIATGDGCNRAIRLVAERPELVEQVVCAGVAPLGRRGTSGSEALAGSGEVLKALLQLFESDYRAAVHSMATTGEPGIDPDTVRARVDANVEHAPQDVATARQRSWYDEDSFDCRGRSATAS